MTRDTDEFDWGQENLVRVLTTRANFEWPYCCKITNINLDDISPWLEENCVDDFRVMVGFHEPVVYFKSQADASLFQLTWHE